jgi:hypothetical protein
LGHLFTDNNGLTGPRLTDRSADARCAAADHNRLIILHGLIFPPAIDTSNSSIFSIAGWELCQNIILDARELVWYHLNQE